MKNTLEEFGERRLVRRIKKIVDDRSSHELSLDDAVCLPFELGSGMLWVTIDPCVIPNLVQYIGMGDYYHAGWFCAVKALSDIAATGAVPLGLTVAAEFSRNMAISDFDSFFDGFVDCASAHDTCLLGGNIKETQHGSHAVSFAVGSTTCGRALNRGRVQPGYVMYVLGKEDFGSFCAGIAAYLNRKICKELGNETLRRLYTAALKPKAKLKEGQLMLNEVEPAFCMDTSDGLLEGCIELAATQKVDVVISLNENLFCTSVLQAAKVCNCDPRIWALSWGGCELLCVAQSDVAERTRKALKAIAVEPVVVGEIRDGMGQVFIEIDDRLLPVKEDSLFGGEQFRPSSFRQSEQRKYLDAIISCRLEDIVLES